MNLRFLLEYIVHFFLGVLNLIAVLGKVDLVSFLAVAPLSPDYSKSVKVPVLLKPGHSESDLVALFDEFPVDQSVSLGQDFD